jgi:23S rRNA pseudouridine1911/1915/1917 synthase
VAASDAGLRLDAFLAARGAFASRAAAQRAIERGEVSVDGLVRPKNHRVEEGERVAVDLPEEAAPPRPPEASRIAVVHEDTDLMVVDKPAGLVTHPAPGHHGVTLAELLPDGSRVVHRLDKDTSGLLLVARTDEALEALQRMMKAREVTREYLALVEGHPDAESGTIDAPIGRDRGNRTVMSTRTDRARDAVTHFQVVERLPRTALLRVRLETGRTHQIRVHLASIGLHIVGDPLYRPRRVPRLGDPARAIVSGMGRLALHACELGFEHPISGEKLAFTRPPPDLFAELFHALEAEQAAFTLR